MFDLRYHVASLAAVFLALIIGIVVGVGISGKGFVQNSERRLLNEKIADLNSRLDAATRRGADLTRSQRAAQAFVEDAYPALMSGRLSGTSIGLVFAGPIDRRRPLPRRADARATPARRPPLRVRALKLPSTSRLCAARSRADRRSPRSPPREDRRAGPPARE